jgi:hypothetical protein
MGYREGIEEGKTSSLQNGFNRGFRDGARLGKKFGMLRGYLKYANRFLHAIIRADDAETLTLTTSFLLMINSTLIEIHSDPTKETQLLKDLKALEQEIADLTGVRDKLFSLIRQLMETGKHGCENHLEDEIEHSNEDERDNCVKCQTVSFEVQFAMGGEKLFAQYKKRVDNILKEFGIEM